MRDLNEKINDLCIKSIKMRREAYGLDFDKSQELRKQQDEVYKKYMFLKNMKKAIERTEKNEN